MKPLLKIVPHDTHGIILIKPQFEVGKKYLNKKGVVNREIGKKAAFEIRNWINQNAEWSSLGVTPSPILGGSGNQEYLIAVKRV